eukprot:752985-Hanusia_phi.AAC.2
MALWALQGEEVEVDEVRKGAIGEERGEEWREDQRRGEERREDQRRGEERRGEESRRRVLRWGRARKRRGTTASFTGSGCRNGSTCGSKPARASSTGSQGGRKRRSEGRRVRSGQWTGKEEGEEEGGD